MEHDFIVGFTLFTPIGFKTIYRHFDKLETAKLFASNIDIKNNCKIYVDLEFHEDEMKKSNKLYENKFIKKGKIKMNKRIEQIKKRLKNTPKSCLNEKYVEDINYLIELYENKNKDYMKLQAFYSNNYVRKSIIENKIEELHKKVKGYQCVKNIINLYQRKVLQELLEGEKTNE